MAQERQFMFTYTTLAELIGLTRNAVHQHACRGRFDPTDLASVCVYLARYGSKELKMEIIKKARDVSRPDDPGGWQAKRARKKKAAARRTAKAKAKKPAKKATRKRRSA